MKVYLLIGLSIIIGCSQISTLDNRIIKGTGDFIYLKTDGSINPKSNHIYYYEEPLYSWLFYGNTSKNELIIYKLTTGEIEKRIHFDRYGPDGIGGFRGVLVNNFDSIFLISATYYNNFFLTDTSGRVKKKYVLQPVDNKNILPALMPLFSHVNQQNVFQNNLINLGTYLFSDVTNIDLHKEVLSITYDLELCAIPGNTNYPKFESKNKESLSGYSRTFNGERFIYSFGRLEEIYLQDSKGEYSKINAKSKYQKKSLDWHNNQIDPIEVQRKRNIRNPQYKSILFDKYRRYTYRFFLPGYDVKVNEPLEKHAEYPDLFSIIIMDENLNVVGETLLPEKTYDPYMKFIAKEGLYLALHINHPLYDPDLLAFEKMEVIIQQ